MQPKRVFLSWSGPISQRVASALAEWIPNVLQSVEPFLSSDDIEMGSRWADKVKSELENSTYGIICLTPDNISKPWINFEAGALSSRYGKERVCPLLFGLTETQIEGPLTQFQMSTTEKGKMFKIIEGINSIKDDPDAGWVIKEDQLRKSFEAFWPDLNRSFMQIEQDSSSKGAPTKRSQYELIEEVVGIVREIRGGVGEIHANILRSEERKYKDLILERQRREARDSIVHQSMRNHRLSDEQLEKIMDEALRLNKMKRDSE